MKRRPQEEVAAQGGLESALERMQVASEVEEFVSGQDAVDMKTRISTDQAVAYADCYWFALQARSKVLTDWIDRKCRYRRSIVGGLRGTSTTEVFRDVMTAKMARAQAEDRKGGDPS